MMIRKACPEDGKLLANLALRLWPHHDPMEMEAEFQAVLRSEEGACFLAADIGFAQCQLRHDYVEGTESSPVGYLEGIYVSEDHRGKGIAGQLLSACQAWAKAMGCTEFASDCALTNTESQHFHERMGFTEANRIVCYTKKL